MEIKDINLGGLSDSVYQGVANSVANIKNLDLHSENGIIKLKKKMTSVSGINVDGFYQAGVVTTGNVLYLFSDDGHVCSRYGGSWSNKTVISGAGDDGVYDAKEYDGYVYYSRERRLGRFPTNSYSSKDDDWGTLVGDVFERPMCVVNEILYGYATIINSPIPPGALGYEGPIAIGDTLLVHHNVFKFYNDMKGRQQSGRSFFREDMFLVDFDQFYMYRTPGGEWIPQGRYCFVQPVPPEDSTIFKPTSFKPFNSSLRNISPTNPRWTPSGLTMASVCSIDILILDT